MSPEEQADAERAELRAARPSRVAMSLDDLDDAGRARLQRLILMSEMT